MTKFILGGSFMLILNLFFAPLHAQVGINEEKPAQGVAFQVKSAKGATDPGVVVKATVDEAGREGVQLLVGDKPADDPDPIPASASVALNAPDKAFIPNRVRLMSPKGGPNDASNPNPIRVPKTGMIIYNTNTTNVPPPNNVVEGLYIYSETTKNIDDGTLGRWLHSEVSTDISDIRLYKLVPDNDNNADGQNDLKLPLLAAYTSSNFLNAAALMRIVPAEQTLNESEVGYVAPATQILFSPGAYAVAINLNGKIPNGDKNGADSRTYTLNTVWIGIVGIDENNQRKILDIAEISSAAYTGNNRIMTYPITLGFQLKEKENISIYIASKNNVDWYLSDHTTMTFWKI
jgi:hypothetical protein